MFAEGPTIVDNVLVDIAIRQLCTRVAVHRLELQHHGAGQWVGQLLKSPVAEVKVLDAW
jgi:hypothetical protein